MKSARCAEAQHFLARHCAVTSKMPLVSRAQGPCRTQKRAWNMCPSLYSREPCGPFAQEWKGWIQICTYTRAAARRSSNLSVC
jgi:hypothetical protein